MPPVAPAEWVLCLQLCCFMKRASLKLFSLSHNWACCIKLQSAPLTPPTSLQSPAAHCCSLRSPSQAAPLLLLLGWEAPARCTARWATQMFCR